MNKVRKISSIRVEKVAINLGAEIKGVDLAELDDATFKAIEEALVEHQVLVFRDQHDLTTEQFIAFGERFGELSVHPFSPADPDRPHLIVFDNDENNPPLATDVWHSDETFREVPPTATILRAIEVPRIGGDTLFSSMIAAYDGLNERLKQYVSGLEGIHDMKPFRVVFEDAENKADLHYFEDVYPMVPHPVVREHPVSKKKVLFVNPQFTIKIKGMGEAESESLLNLLFDQAKVPEYQYRHHWEAGTVVVWDNRSVQHYAVHDYYPHRRLMERVTVKGTDRPHMAEAPVDAASLKSRKSKFPDDPKIKHGGHAPKKLATR